MEDESCMPFRFKRSTLLRSALKTTDLGQMQRKVRIGLLNNKARKGFQSGARWLKLDKRKAETKNYSSMILKFSKIAPR